MGLSFKSCRHPGFSARSLPIVWNVLLRVNIPDILEIMFIWCWTMIYAMPYVMSIFLFLQNVNFYRATQYPLQICTCGKCQLNIYIYMLIVSNAISCTPPSMVWSTYNARNKFPLTGYILEKQMTSVEYLFSLISFNIHFNISFIFKYCIYFINTWFPGLKT